MEETSMRIAGQWCSAFRALDENGQVIDVSVNPTRDTEAARVVLIRAIDKRGMMPDNAPIDPRAWSAVRPPVDHSVGTVEQHGMERDHQHRTGRIGSMRGCPTVSCAQVVCAGHALARNRADGFDRLGLPLGDPRPPQAPRVVRAWEQLTAHVAAA